MSQPTAYFDARGRWISGGKNTDIMAKRNRRYSYINQHAAIKAFPNDEAQLGGLTFTSGREDDFNAHINTDSSNTTYMGINLGPSSISLSGRQARTLQRLLNKHFTECGVPSILGAE